MMKIALIYPPTCDPTAPYLSVPTLTGYLRAHGVEVRPIDANVEAYSRLLSRETLTVLAGRVERRWSEPETQIRPEPRRTARRRGALGGAGGCPKRPRRHR